jgi:hypothetical protein
MYLERINELYNTAVQSFVRRDHVKTQKTLDQLFILQKSHRSRKPRLWYELEDCSSADSELEEWIIKSLKLYISSQASMHLDPPKDSVSLNSGSSSLLPSTPPDIFLQHLQKSCEDEYFSSTQEPRLLPPHLLSTFLLASINLRPVVPALNFAHNLAETWLSSLPDHLIVSFSTKQSWSPADKKRIEGMREGYLKVVELFVGEILVREGEWEMARGILEGEDIMSSKRKEVCHIGPESLINTS